MLFGSELFEEYIGQLAMASMASLDIFTEGEQFDAKKLQEKMRVNHFTCMLSVYFIQVCIGLTNKYYFQRMLKVKSSTSTGCSKRERRKACRTTKK